MSYSPTVLVPSRHHMVVDVSSAYETAPSTFIHLFVGMTEEEFHQASGARRMNCRETFIVDSLPEGKYQLRHASSARPKLERVRGVTARAQKLDVVLQKFVDSVRERV